MYIYLDIYIGGGGSGARAFPGLKGEDPAGMHYFEFSRCFKNNLASNRFNENVYFSWV